MICLSIYCFFKLGMGVTTGQYCSSVPYLKLLDSQQGLLNYFEQGAFIHLFRSCQPEVALGK